VCTRTSLKSWPKRAPMNATVAGSSVCPGDRSTSWTIGTSENVHGFAENMRCDARCSLQLEDKFVATERRAFCRAGGQVFLSVTLFWGERAHVEILASAISLKRA
jgi:hypothetical protein